MQKLWSDDLLTGLRIIDTQHREFFTRVEGLLTECMSVDAEAGYPRTFEFLRSYVDKHFATEEGLMDLHAFPQAGFHKSQHRWFLTEIDRIHTEALRGGATASVQTQFNYLLIDWFRSHIRGVDVILVAYLKDKPPA